MVFIKKCKKIVNIFFKFIFSVIATIIEYIATIHSGSSLASWTRIAGSGIIITGIVATFWSIKLGFLQGQPLSNVICSAFGALAVIIGAGKIAEGISGTSVQSKSFSFLDTAKGFFGKLKNITPPDDSNPEGK
jgi:hypothetical protein